MSEQVGNVSYYLVVDLEGTCCDDGSIPDDERETIEIGAVMVDADSMEKVDEFGILVKPVRHPVLTEFCVGLTGISQSDVDGSLEFPAAFRKFFDWRYAYRDVLFCSWGKYDPQQFGRDCRHHDIQCSFISHTNANHLDLSQLFTSKTGRRRGNRGAAKFLGLATEGKSHRGPDCARNIANMLPFLLT